MKKTMSLHEAVIKVLRDNGNLPLSYNEIAKRINKDKLYIRPSDGKGIEDWQIRLRTYVSKTYKHLFIVDDDKGIVKLFEQ